MENNQNTEKELPEVEQELSQVAASPKQSMMILVGIVLVFIYLFYSFFISSNEPDVSKKEIPKPKEISKPVEVSADSEIPTIPTLPSPPKLEDPTAPPPPPTNTVEPLPVADSTLPPLPTQDQAELDLPSPAPSTNAPPSLPFGNVKTQESDKQLQKKRKSSIFLVAGAPPQKTPEQLQQEVDFSNRGDMNLVLGRGKMIEAIIETAVNTDFGGEIRAVINRDIYSEWGRNILIPKGSRVYGNYATGIDGAYGSVSIEWTRINLANGYILNLSGTGTDNLGRKGNQGRVDNKFKERLSNSVLKSVLNISLANTLDKLVKPQASSQAVASQNVQATNIQNTANATFTQAGLTDAQKRAQICANVLAAITDKTSTAFTQINNGCNNPTGTTDADKLTSLMSIITSAANSLLSNSTTNVQETKVQAASKEAFTDISDTIKTLVEEQDFKPTITIDQGTAVKIYVNKDYKFPKAAISKSRRLR
jgi:type IV secretion system protein VirB10